MEEEKRITRRRAYKRPGLWRARELYFELNVRLELGYDTSTPEGLSRLGNWFRYMRQLRIIPDGQEKCPVERRGKRMWGGMQMAWTDQQVEEITGLVQASMDQSSSRRTSHQDTVFGG